jgi:prepilin-type N-terminal cleavage/methylation domain-containing protein
MANAQFKMKSAFSLVELLVVIAILCILFALLFPVIIGVKGTALRVSCANNLRQVALVCNAFAEDHGGDLPQANSANPHTFKFTVGAVIDPYMDDNNIPPDIWYCPAMLGGYYIPESWMSHSTPKAAFGEFPIGYNYVGNPSPGGMSKFVKPVPVNIYTMDSAYELIFDICQAPRPAHDQARYIDTWSSFPHLGRDRPSGAQVLMADFSLQYRNKNSLTVGYKFIGPSNMYW